MDLSQKNEKKKRKSEIKKQDSIAAFLVTQVKSVVGNDWLVMNVGNIWLIFVGVEHQLGHRPVFFSSC